MFNFGKKKNNVSAEVLIKLIANQREIFSLFRNEILEEIYQDFNKKIDWNLDNKDSKASAALKPELEPRKVARAEIASLLRGNGNKPASEE